MKIPYYFVIILFFGMGLIFAYPLLSILPLDANIKNLVLCYCFFICIAGIYSDVIVFPNKPFRSKRKILKEFKKDWNTKKEIWEIIDFGRVCQKGYELYSLGNINYQDKRNWTWNQEISHCLMVAIYPLLLLFLFLNEKRAFNIGLLFVSISLCMNYVYYIITTINELRRGIHKDTQ